MSDIHIIIRDHGTDGRVTRNRHTQRQPCEHKEKTAISKHRRVVSEETNPADTLISGFQAPEL
jgi:hypothetical protein